MTVLLTCLSEGLRSSWYSAILIVLDTTLLPLGVRFLPEMDDPVPSVLSGIISSQLNLDEMLLVRENRLCRTGS